MKKVVMFFAEGCEEVEGLAVIDLLRRCKMDVCMASVSGNEMVTGSHNITFKSDAAITDINVEDFDAFLLPGGIPGTPNLDASKKVHELITKANEAGKVVGAICAAPTVLGSAGLLEGKKACCYPGFEEGLKGAEVVMEPVVVDGNIVTSRGLGTVFNFGFALIEKLLGKEEAEAMKKKIVY